MSKNIETLLQKRMHQKEDQEKKKKVQTLALRSSQGELSSASSLLGAYSMSEEEKERLRSLLFKYQGELSSVERDLKTLLSITSEVRSIDNQAALLHGERIKKVRELLLHYKEGAFSNWLMHTYGNRQTPYNLLQYYEFYSQLPPSLRSIVDSMPRQVIYTLAARSVPALDKEKFIHSFSGQSKEELLDKIRTLFPLPISDERRRDLTSHLLGQLEKSLTFCKKHKKEFSSRDKELLLHTLDEIKKEIST